MGGQSYKCPCCKRWFLSKGALHDHAKDAHALVNIKISGVGPLTVFEEGPNMAHRAAFTHTGDRMITVGETRSYLIKGWVDIDYHTPAIPIMCFSPYTREETERPMLKFRSYEEALHWANEAEALADKLQAMHEEMLKKQETENV